MDNILNMITVVVESIVDDASVVVISSSESEKGVLYEVKASAEDTGKLIGREGRVASALRTLAKAAGAKNDTRVLVNVSKDPVEKEQS